MKRMCAWCQTELPAKGRGRNVTHTICDSCLDNLLYQMGGYLRNYLDSFTLPIILVNSEGKAAMTNATACAALGKCADEIEGQLGGVVFECAHARLPGGCGQTVCCSGCVIRRTVMATFTDGKSRKRVPAALTRDTQADQQIDLLISTEKAGDYVLLRIDHMHAVDVPAPTVIPGLAEEIADLRQASTKTCTH